MRIDKPGRSESNPDVARDLQREKRWLAENRAALDAYNQAVAQYGLLSDETGLHQDSRDHLTTPEIQHGR